MQMVPERIRGVDDFAGIELGQPNVSDGLGGDDMARSVVHLAAEVVGEIGVVSEMWTDLLSVDGVDDVLRMNGRSQFSIAIGINSSLCQEAKRALQN